ncbi:MAG: hypothetical protein ACE14M_08275 [Terriglobales bacterium]
MKTAIFNRPVALILALLTIMPPALRAQEGPLIPNRPKGITPEEIIQKFAAKEKEFKLAREQYTYRQKVKIETLDGDTVDGTYEMTFDVLFDDQGRRTQQVVYAPQSTLRKISVTREDLDDIENRLPFVLTSDEVPEYNITYIGQQRQDELDTYVFDIAPKIIEKSKRYFQGRIWVDNQDFQIVKTKGKTVPDIRNKSGENLFPSFTTWREQIDGRYWFPTYTRAEDTLHFKAGDVRIREIIRYTNYKRFGSNVKITYEGQEVKREKPGDQRGQQNPPPPK